MAHALIALGSNLGNRHKTLDSAVAAVAGHPSIRLASLSPVFESLPAGGPAGQGTYLNAAAVLETSLPPDLLLAELLTVENQLGRKRGCRWDARTIDLDLIFYDDLVLQTQTLVLPHPRMSFRRFVLEPAMAIAPAMRHPTIGWTIADLLDHINRADPYIAVGGPPGSGATGLVETLRQRCHYSCIMNPITTTKDDWLVRVISGSSGSACDAAVECIDKICRLVSRDRWLCDHRTPKTPDEYHTNPDSKSRQILSDFWPRETMVLVQTLLVMRGVDLRRTAVEETFQSAAADILCPQLIVVLDAPDDTVWKNVAESQHGWIHLLERSDFFNICQNLRAYAEQPGHGPMLRLNHISLDRISYEVSAAIDSLKPVVRVDC
ncbi:MAG: 2-amino-4-hydroxy-6-hydroxymethyldihydropteridine diphosphokinase [Pirellulales bacterium]|nr:2-amino-4-hydroxy-6-hydroxymethyldihydropteridine diphosphokinase [Pirellulales bacterium]